MLEKLDGIKRAAVAGLVMVVMGCSGATVNKVPSEDYKAEQEVTYDGDIKLVYTTREVPRWISEPNYVLKEGDERVCAYGMAEYSDIQLRHMEAMKNALLTLCQLTGKEKFYNATTMSVWYPSGYPLNHGSEYILICATLDDNLSEDYNEQNKQHPNLNEETEKVIKKSSEEMYEWLESKDTQ